MLLQDNKLHIFKPFGPKLRTTELMNQKGVNSHDKCYQMLEKSQLYPAKFPTLDPVQSLQKDLNISDSCVGPEWKLYDI